MKKSIKVLGIIGLGLLTTIAIKGVTAEAEYDGNSRDRSPYAYIPNYELREQIAQLSGVRSDDFYQEYGLIEKDLLRETTGKLDDESGSYSLEGIQFLENITKYASEGTNAVDYRPLEKLTQLKEFKDYEAPTYSIDFMKNMDQLEEVYLELSTGMDEDDAALKPILDLTVLNNLSNLTNLAILEEARYSQTIVLKNGMTQYQLVDPVILSDHFADTEVEYESSDEGFSCENGILSWEGLSSETVELRYSWSAVRSTDDGEFRFDGEAIIPLYWK
ncbi:hypothetical protein I6N96_12805 [Enterococcus sp. BWM-S5]|uniref:Secreted protein n=1 Tax=Enterococcus larvae TaxID=2794352 RepID=A0ABS4CN36_9ENTE|nr:hypothetical protein [Enterococcus larvae]MBP1047154.1 hypothetical protein [Enterococcus larvae]